MTGETRVRIPYAAGAALFLYRVIRSPHQGVLINKKQISMIHVTPTPGTLIRAFQDEQFKTAIHESNFTKATEFIYREIYKLKSLSEVDVSPEQAAKLVVGSTNADFDLPRIRVLRKDDHHEIQCPVTGDIDFKIKLSFDGKWVLESSPMRLKRHKAISDDQMIERILNIGYYPVIQ